MNTDTIGIPKIWAQYMNNKDCSQGLCSFYCPQWCYAIFPPPPPQPEDFSSDQSSGPNFSPLVITIIGFLAGALLLVSYYAIISKYCSKRSSSTADDRNNVTVELDHALQPSAHEPWFVASNGLDQALISSIAMFKYRRGDGLVEGTDCSVCLSEFVEDEKLRLLPKCSHAFHVRCIDTWLTRHSNCPLCRANVAGVAPSSLPPQQSQGERESNGEEGNVGIEDLGEVNANPPKRVRRSLSMDSIFRPRSYMVFVEEGENVSRHSVMKRSHSSGRWWFSHEKTTSSVIPL